MKINLIHHDFSSNVLIDAEVMNFILKKMKGKPEIAYINTNSYKCSDADVNIFLEAFNYSFMNNAKINILIPNQHYFHKNWIPFVNEFDYIFCKSKYCLESFKSHVTNHNKLKYTGWKSPDIYYPNVSKEYNEYLAFYQEPVFYPIKYIIELWKPEYPNLNIVCHNYSSIKTLKSQDNIKYIDEKMTSEEFHILFNRCGVHLCLSEIDCFNHLVNQAKIVKSIPISVSKGPSAELFNTEWGFSVASKKKKLKDSLASKYIFDKEDFGEVIKKVMDTHISALEIMGNNGRVDAMKTQQSNEHHIMETLDNILKESKTIVKPGINIEYKPNTGRDHDRSRQNPRNKRKDAKKESKNKESKNKEPKNKESRDNKQIAPLVKDADLPKISIITPTYNRKHIFRMTVLNYNLIDYPRNKIEWVICEDSDKDYDMSIESQLPDEAKRNEIGIKYVKLDAKVSIGEKRNICVENASNDIIVCMDDDDYYPPGSVKERVTRLITSGKDVVGCTTIAGFEINRYISLISSTALNDPYYMRLSEATLAFRKDYWASNKFSDVSTHEAKDFVGENIHRFSEMCWEGIIVSLIHNNNSSVRHHPKKQAPNGCHFGWNQKLFEFITTLDKRPKDEKEEKAQSMLQQLQQQERNKA